MMNEEVMINIVIILLPFALAASVYCYKALEQRLPEKQREALQEFVKIAVRGVEQEYGAVQGRKKDVAMQMVGDMFQAFKLPVPSHDIVSLAIEACVLEMNMFQHSKLAGMDTVKIGVPAPTDPPKTQLPPEPTGGTAS